MESITSLFQYSFVIRGLEAGLVIAVITPLVGIFLVLRRYSLIADTLSHVSLAGIAIGLATGLNPIITALGVSVGASFGIEHLRASKKIYGESALALFLSGSLALAVVILSLGKGFTTNLTSYLFGSILTVTQTDLYTIIVLAIVVCVILFTFYKELVAISFNEEFAEASGIPVRLVNTIFIVLTALTVALAIPIVGILLISALMIIPVVTALQLRMSFAQTILWSELFSVLSVLLGVFTSFFFNFSTGGTIVLFSVLFFFSVFVIKKSI